MENPQMPLLIAKIAILQTVRQWGPRSVLIFAILCGVGLSSLPGGRLHGQEGATKSAFLATVSLAGLAWILFVQLRSCSVALEPRRIGLLPASQLSRALGATIFDWAAATALVALCLLGVIVGPNAGLSAVGDLAPRIIPAIFSIWLACSWTRLMMALLPTLLSSLLVVGWLVAGSQPQESAQSTLERWGAWPGLAQIIPSTSSLWRWESGIEKTSVSLVSIVAAMVIMVLLNSISERTATRAREQ